MRGIIVCLYPRPAKMRQERVRENGSASVVATNADTGGANIALVMTGDPRPRRCTMINEKAPVNSVPPVETTLRGRPSTGTLAPESCMVTRGAVAANRGFHRQQPR